MRPHNSTYETGASGSRNLRPLKGLLPFLTPYRRMLLLALLALLVAPVMVFERFREKEQSGGVYGGRPWCSA